MKLRDIAKHFGVSMGTMENKNREIRDAAHPLLMNPRFALPWCSILDVFAEFSIEQAQEAEEKRIANKGNSSYQSCDRTLNRKKKQKEAFRLMAH